MRSEYVDKALADMFQSFEIDREIIEISYEAYKELNTRKADYVRYQQRQPPKRAKRPFRERIPAC